MTGWILFLVSANWFRFQSVTKLSKMKTSTLLIFTAIFCMANAIFLEDLNPLLDQVQPEGTKIWKRYFMKNLNHLKNIPTYLQFNFFRSTLMANLKRLQEILTTLSTSYPDKCLAPSDFRLILRPLLMEASNIINNLEVDPSFVKLIRKRFNGYIRTIIAQHQHSVRILMGTFQWIINFQTLTLN